MPSGRKDIYGAPSRRLADPKVIKAEMGAQRNAAAAARLAGRKLDADKLLAREGTTNPSGGRPNTPATPKPAPKAAPKTARAAEKLLAREGTTSKAGGRPAVKQAVLRTAPAKPVKPVAKIIPAKQQAIIRTTTNMKPTPTGKKR